MAYPVLPIVNGATSARLTDRQLDRASNGKLRGRVFYTTPKRTFGFTHEWLTPAQKTTLDAFYNSNITAAFSFVWPLDGVSYTCIFAAEPTDTAVSGTYVSVAISLSEV